MEKPKYRVNKNKIDIISNFDWKDRLLKLKNGIKTSIEKELNKI